MKVIKTATYLNDTGPSVDDQPNFKKRDNKGQDFSLYDPSIVPDSPKDVIKKWKTPQQTKKKTKKPSRNSI